MLKNTHITDIGGVDRELLSAMSEWRGVWGAQRVVSANNFINYLTSGILGTSPENITGDQVERLFSGAGIAGLDPTDDADLLNTLMDKYLKNDPETLEYFRDITGDAEYAAQQDGRGSKALNFFSKTFFFFGVAVLSMDVEEAYAAGEPERAESLIIEFAMTEAAGELARVATGVAAGL